MKRVLLIIICLLFSLPLMQMSGRGQGSFTAQQDIERFLPVETIGFDREDTGITVTLTTSKLSDGSTPILLTGPASGIEPALTRLQDYSPKDELYFDHIQYILLGEDLSSRDVTPVLDWVERSPFMRMDTYVFLVKDSAKEAMTAASGEMYDITDRLSSLEREAVARGQHIYTLLEIASGLADRGSALCLAIESVPSDGTVYGADNASPGNAFLPAGYGVLQDGKLIAYLSQGETLGAMLFRQDPTGTEIAVDGAALELLQGRAEVSGQWSEEGDLTALLITARVTAGITEQTTSSQTDPDALSEALAAVVEDWLYSVVTRSQALSCDFLALEDSVLPPALFSSRKSHLSWWEVFPDLPIVVTVDADIQRGYDRAD